MEFGITTFGLAYLAGVLSTLSPCVLPILPILIGAALAEHRFGTLALAVGLTLSFTVLGLFLATIGASLGIEQHTFRVGAAIVLIALALLLLVAPLQQRFASATSGISDAGNRLLSRFKLQGLSGQFLIGLLLGVLWSPCVGPTLGAASTLAAQGQNLAEITLLMLVFGLGAGSPLLILGAISRNALMRIRTRLFAAAKAGKLVLGVILLFLGIAILTGTDKALEAWILDISPDWLTNLTTRY
jgi:cytochrome c biogenesis protein CcdA